jgi:hypothetical protein
MPATHILIISWGKQSIERPINASGGRNPNEAAQELVDHYQGLRNADNPDKPQKVTGKLYAHCADFKGATDAVAIVPVARPRDGMVPPPKLPKDAKFLS